MKLLLLHEKIENCCILFECNNSLSVKPRKPWTPEVFMGYYASQVWQNCTINSNMVISLVWALLAYPDLFYDSPLLKYFRCSWFSNLNNIISKYVWRSLINIFWTFLKLSSPWFFLCIVPLHVKGFSGFYGDSYVVNASSH